MALRDIRDWEDLRGELMTWILILLLGWLGGWVHAHHTVAKECERLGSFYVGSKTYHCTKVEDRP